MLDLEDKYIDDIIKGLSKGFGFDDEEKPKTTAVELKPIWSLFKYIYTPQSAYSTLKTRRDTIYFTLPIGSVSEIGNYHYITFPAFSTADDIKEICYNYATGAIFVVKDDDDDEIKDEDTGGAHK